jgi:hypothetical protein
MNFILYICGTETAHKIMSTYKSFDITKDGDHYNVIKDGRRYLPSDAFIPRTVKQCKDAVNAIISGKSSEYGIRLFV